MDYLLPVVIAYLLGSISPSILLCRMIKGCDIRDFGSGNAGSTNAFRVLGRTGGITVMAVDILKGAAAVHAGSLLFGNTSMYLALLCGIAVIAGHIWTLFHGFKGGKGVNTATGVLLGLLPVETFMVVGVFLIVLFSSGYVSLSSMIASVALPLAVIAKGIITGNEADCLIILFVSLMPVLIVYTHRSNISRLRNGTEKKIFKKEKGGEPLEKAEAGQE